MAAKSKVTKSGGKSPLKKLKGHSESTYLHPAPLKVETHTTERGERMTTVSFPEPYSSPVTHSADQLLSDAIECPAILSDPVVWFFIMPWLKNSPDEIREFWSAFNTASASRNRIRAVAGKKADSWKNERSIIQMVGLLRRLRSSEREERPGHAMFSLEATLLAKLGDWVMNAVESDPEALFRLRELLKDPSASDDKTNRDHIPRNVFHAFAKLVAKEEMLPTKKAVREQAFLGNDDNARSIASREFRELGLSGLPRG